MNKWVFMLQWLILYLPVKLHVEFWHLFYRISIKMVKLNNYSTKWRWLAVDIYWAVKRWCRYPPLATDTELNSWDNINQKKLIWLISSLVTHANRDAIISRVWIANCHDHLSANTNSQKEPLDILNQSTSLAQDVIKFRLFP